MTELHPFQLLPEFVERVWGTRDLSFLYKQSVGTTPIGEVWLTGDQCRIASGLHKGRTLADLSRQFGSALTGTSKCADRFPLLMKVLFPREKLSVQVHPDDTTAQAAGEPCGKTECWYILHAESGAQIGLGFQPGTEVDEIERAIHEHRMEHLLNWLDVKAGEMYYVDAGTVHAIGPGSVIVETQQNSDTTYRLYDYGRPRELHAEQGLAAVKLKTNAGKVQRPADHPEPKDGNLNLVSSPCFVVNKRHLDRAWEFRRPRHLKKSVWCVVALRGYGTIECEGAAPVTFSSGDAVVVPAVVEKFTLKPQWELEFLCASLPAEKVGQPATVLHEALAGHAK